MTNSWTSHIYLLVSVVTALLANYVAAMWGKDGNRWSWWLPTLILLSPLVFISFGLMTHRLGLSVGAGLSDSLLSVCTIFVGLIALQEWQAVSFWQYIGILFAVVGIILMALFPK